MKYLQPDWPAPKNIMAYTTLRSGFAGRYAQAENETDRRDGSSQLQTWLQLPQPPVWLKQTHGTVVVAAAPENLDREADASFAFEPGQVCAILTADCLPILICNKQGTRVAAVHAGWRGLAAGIVEATLAAIQQPAQDLLVWLGPAIGPGKFEVGEDVFHAFTRYHPGSTTAFAPCAPGKWLANLYDLARMRLSLSGVTNTYGGDFCTYSQPDLFYSYRRDKGNTGRMASLIWMNPRV
ncbi:Laccase domain protein YfiH [Aquicella siphonis]|uniref:Purine nucleoside phosphorylase n=1 Tax=Aquicella siphonis TaxID=254247 RepID=A0A5E4PI56_9COXI|nr:peptidoglycan editing factor PgeF [Aquicella siphonis]VVC76107.1 Laccase domain protein YfiH [Aquicella siphonis]